MSSEANVMTKPKGHRLPSTSSEQVRTVTPCLPKEFSQTAIATSPIRIPAATPVVIRYWGHSIKGYVDQEHPSTSIQNADTASPTIDLYRPEQVHSEPVCIANVKAVFFVKTLQGDAAHTDILFNGNRVPPKWIWLCILFHDGEVMEGMIENDGTNLVGSGFFLIPTDPDSNSWLVYVPKESIKTMHILGLRARIDRLTVAHKPDAMEEGAAASPTASSLDFRGSPALRESPDLVPEGPA